MGEKYRNLIEKIAYGLAEENLIDIADVEAYKFGLEVTILKALHYVSYIAIALCMKKFIEFVIIFSIFYAFRRNTGGFHIQTRIGCYLFSCAVIFLCLFATSLSFNWWSMMTVSILDLIVLLILSPVQHSNRKLDEEDVVCFRRRLKILSLVFLIIYAVTFGMRGMYLIEMYTIGVTMVTVLAILGKLSSFKQG